ncbi:hypothetical protein [Actinotignum urinale]|uniref:hypothetical protein n=1 Tax=Actinotignum urinale TaxID=190146 RepID=UPI0003B379E1|nr:hypothetical protein [Actinotignum urinale]MDY5159637.1 hypothetical protein [Actinotignum urinale]
MEHVEPKLRKPEIIRPQKADEQKPIIESDEVKIALEILLGIDEHKAAADTDLVRAARQFRDVLNFLTKIFGGAL